MLRRSLTLPALVVAVAAVGVTSAGHRLCRPPSAAAPRSAARPAGEDLDPEQWFASLAPSARGRALERLSRSAGAAFTQHVLLRWLAADFPAASQWAAAHASADAVVIALVADCAVRTPADPACLGAPAAAESAWPGDFLRAVARTAFARAPDRAMALVFQHAAPAERATLLMELTRAWTAGAPESARPWIRQLHDAHLRDALVCAAAGQLGPTDPVRAAEWIATDVESPATADGAMLALVDVWPAARCDAAARLVDHFSAGPLRTAAVATVARRWMQANPVAAYIWIKGLPESDGLISTIAALDSSR